MTSFGSTDLPRSEQSENVRAYSSMYSYIHPTLVLVHTLVHILFTYSSLLTSTHNAPPLRRTPPRRRPARQRMGPLWPRRPMRHAQPPDAGARARRGGRDPGRRAHRHGPGAGLSVAAAVRTGRAATRDHDQDAAAGQRRHAHVQHAGEHPVGRVPALRVPGGGQVFQRTHAGRSGE